MILLIRRHLPQKNWILYDSNYKERSNQFRISDRSASDDGSFQISKRSASDVQPAVVFSQRHMHILEKVRERLDTHKISEALAVAVYCREGPLRISSDRNLCCLLGGGWFWPDLEAPKLYCRFGKPRMFTGLVKRKSFKDYGPLRMWKVSYFG